MKKNKKTKYYQKDKVKQELIQLETDYVNKLQDAKNTCKIKLADLKQEPDKSNLIILGIDIPFFCADWGTCTTLAALFNAIII